MSNSSQPAPATNAQPKGSERRASVRFLCNLDISCQSTGHGKKDRWEASIRDISHEGMGLVMKQQFATGTVIGIELQSPDDELSYTMFARVMHSTPLPDGHWRVGCLFVRILSDDELNSLL